MKWNDIKWLNPPATPLQPPCNTLATPLQPPCIPNKKNFVKINSNYCQNDFLFIDYLQNR